MTIQFSLIIFSYEKILYLKILSKWIPTSFSNNENLIKIMISIIRTIFMILFIWKYNSYAYNKLETILKHTNGAKKLNRNKNAIITIITVSPLFCSIFCVGYYLLKIFFKFLGDIILFLYCEIFLYIIKENSKLYIIIVCGLIIYSLNKIKRSKEFKIIKIVEEKKTQLKEKK